MVSEAGLLGGALALLCVLAGVWRTPTPAVERHVWRWMLSGVLAVDVCALAASILRLTFGPERAHQAAGAVFDAGCVIACFAFYQGLVRWNRTRTLTSDPSDWINGLSSVLVLVALGDLAVAVTGHSDQGSHGWAAQLDMVAFASAGVLLGTVPTVANIAGLMGDLRIRLVMAAMTAGVAGATLVVIVGEPARPLEDLLWLLGVGVIAGCVRLAPAVETPLPALNRPTIIGSLVVTVVGLGVLTVNTGLFFDVDHVVTAFAAVGTLGAGVRIVQLVQDLAHLTQTRLEALSDDLTGIPNRRSLLLSLQEALLAGPATLLLIDLDRFKIINDRYGHATGDLVLRHAAEVFTGHLPARSVLARLSGDEFAVLIAGDGASFAVELAHQLCAGLLPFTDAQGRRPQLGASVGISSVGAGSDPSQLLHRADAAMYQAKTTRSGVCVYDGALDALAQERLALLEDLQLALGPGDRGEEEIVAFFQPQIGIRSGQVVGAEALARWWHPRLGLLAPDRFMALVEENGLMGTLTARILTQAVRECARWQQAGFALRVSVNLSATSLSHPDTLALVEQALRGGLPPDRLVLEVTETSLMVEPDLAVAAMRQIAKRGVGVSIDDYGTGYSSLSYLKDFPATELKIDRSFVIDMLGGTKTTAIVAATVDIAHRLGLRVVAEGVENQATLALLADLGCDESQGYLHSRPVDAATFLDWLSRRNVPAGVPAQGQRAS